MNLWISGRTQHQDSNGVVWELNGVFDTEEKAVEACTRANDFVGPVDLNERFPEDSIEFPGSYYPHLKRAR